MSNTSTISPDFVKIIKEFVNDIKNTFPEYSNIITSWWNIENDEDESTTMEMLHKHCINVFPERLMDILYQNKDIFNNDSTINTEFLPGISFKYLWNYDISDSTRDTIWKYLQMIVIAIVGNIQDKSLLGDTSKIFDSINENDFKDKLQETLENIQNVFDTKSDGDENEQSQLPDVNALHGHMEGLLGGKLGQLAQEIAEETTEGLDIDLDNINNVNDVFQTLFKNPGKLMGLVKDVGEKLDSRMKNGEINQSELLSEASEMVGKMKNMPGLNNIQEMMGKMGMNISNIPNMNNANVQRNMNAMESKIKQNAKSESLRERLKKKALQNNYEQAMKQSLKPSAAIQKEQTPPLTDQELLELFEDNNIKMVDSPTKDSSGTKSSKKNKKVKKA